MAQSCPGGEDGRTQARSRRRIVGVLPAFGHGAGGARLQRSAQQGRPREVERGSESMDLRLGPAPRVRIIPRPGEGLRTMMDQAMDQAPKAEAVAARWVEKHAAGLVVVRFGVASTGNGGCSDAHCGGADPCDVRSERHGDVSPEARRDASVAERSGSAAEGKQSALRSDQSFKDRIPPRLRKKLANNCTTRVREKWYTWPPTLHRSQRPDAPRTASRFWLDYWL